MCRSCCDIKIAELAESACQGCVCGRVWISVGCGTLPASPGILPAKLPRPYGHVMCTSIEGQFLMHSYQWLQHHASWPTVTCLQKGRCLPVCSVCVVCECCCANLGWTAEWRDCGVVVKEGQYAGPGVFAACLPLSCHCSPNSVDNCTELINQGFAWMVVASYLCTLLGLYQ